MNSRLVVLMIAVSILTTSCSGEKGPFREVRTWKFQGPQVAMAFYAASPDQSEEAMRSKTESVMATLLKEHQQAQVIVLYDLAQARKVSSRKAVEKMMRGGGADVSVFFYGGKTEGGGYLSGSRNQTAPRWIYVPLRDTAKPSRDRGFSK